MHHRGNSGDLEQSNGDGDDVHGDVDEDDCGRRYLRWVHFKKYNFKNTVWKKYTLQSKHK